MANQQGRIVAVLVALCATAVLSACGDDSEVSPTTRESTSQAPSESPSEPLADGAIPECSDVWVAGAELPKDYTSCMSDGETVKPVKHRCGFGAMLLEHDGRYFGMLGKPVSDAGDLATNEDYQQLLASCQA